MNEYGHPLAALEPKKRISDIFFEFRGGRQAALTKKVGGRFTVW